MLCIFQLFYGQNYINFSNSKCMSHDSVNYNMYIGMSQDLFLLFYPNHEVTFGLFGKSACSRICFKICRLYAVGRKQVKYEVLLKWTNSMLDRYLQGLLK